MESILEKFLGSDIAYWVAMFTSVVGIFALIATKTKNNVDNQIAQFLMDLINFLGANVGEAKNSS